jgi:SAM-dependent methyltransferase
MAVPLAERGVRITGIDIAPKMLAVLRTKRTDIDVMLAEAERMPLREGAFDAALFVHILHLVPDAAATVRATLRTVRAGGVVVYGGDDRNTGDHDEADRIIERAVLDISGIDLGLSDPHDTGAAAFETVSAAAGAKIERRTLARWTGSAQGRRMVDRLAAKAYSSSWRIPDEKLPAIVKRVTPQLAALFGDLDREVPFERSFSMMVARMPVAER